MDKGKEVRFIFLDISKAFDRVRHKGVLYKLEKAGVGGNLLKWLKNYLTDRRQRVVVEGEESDLKPITAGVPQGSILGPVLFILYVNDLIENLGPNIRMYAYDVTLFVEYDHPLAAKLDLQEKIEIAMAWAKDWLVSFNPQKSISVVFSRKRETIIPQIEIDGIPIQEEEAHKHLGLTIQKNGKWSKHITDITTRAQRRVDILRGHMYTLDRQSLQKLYISFIRPLLEQNDIIWDNCTEQQKNEVEKVQISAARVITGAKKGTSHNLLYQETNLEKLQNRRENHKITSFIYCAEN